jgi:hypothetical protein
MAPRVPTSEIGTATAGITVGAHAAQEQEDDQDHQHHGQPQLKLHVRYGGLDGNREVGHLRDFDRGRQVRLKLGQDGLNTLHHADGVGAGLPLDVQDHRRRLVHPGCLVVVLYSIHHLRHILERHRSAIAIRDNDVLVIAAALELVVGIDLIILPRAVEIALGGVHAGLHQRGAKLLESDAVGGELRGIGLDTHRRLLAAANAHQADPS